MGRGNKPCFALKIWSVWVVAWVTISCAFPRLLETSERVDEPPFSEFAGRNATFEIRHWLGCSPRTFAMFIETSRVPSHFHFPSSPKPGYRWFLNFFKANLPASFLDLTPQHNLSLFAVESGAASGDHSWWYSNGDEERTADDRQFLPSTGRRQRSIHSVRTHCELCFNFFPFFSQPHVSTREPRQGGSYLPSLLDTYGSNIYFSLMNCDFRPCCGRQISIYCRTGTTSRFLLWSALMHFIRWEREWRRLRKRRKSGLLQCRREKRWDSFGGKFMSCTFRCITRGSWLY